jgi:predicted  nucleic acid-binding Zn-ribbon protein
VTIHEQVVALESLGATDAELKELNDALASERAALERKRGILSELQEKLDRARASSDEMERTRGELMQEVRQLGVQLDKSREKLSRCRTEREVNAAQREVEELRKLYRDRELEIQKLSELGQQARGEMAQTQAEAAEIEAELAQNEGQVASRLTSLERDVAAKVKERQALVARLKPQLYRRYEMILKRRGTAVAHTTDGTCSACHMMLSPMVFQQLMRRDDFSQCPSCNRIIYYKPAPGEAEDSQASGA